MPAIHLLAIVIVVLAILGLTYYLLNSIVTDARIKQVINVVLVLGLVIWLLLWLLPRLIAVAS